MRNIKYKLTYSDIDVVSDLRKCFVDLRVYRLLVSFYQSITSVDRHRDHLSSSDRVFRLEQILTSHTSSTLPCL